MLKMLFSCGLDCWELKVWSARTWESPPWMNVSSMLDQPSLKSKTDAPECTAYHVAVMSWEVPEKYFGCNLCQIPKPCQSESQLDSGSNTYVQGNHQRIEQLPVDLLFHHAKHGHPTWNLLYIWDYYLRPSANTGIGFLSRLLLGAELFAFGETAHFMSVENNYGGYGSDRKPTHSFVGYEWKRPN